MEQKNAQGTNITMPHLAESLVSGTLGKWLKQPGDYVEQFDVICELITDKVNTEMPCPIEGTLVEIVAAEGETVDVGATICIIAEAGKHAQVEETPAQVTPTQDTPIQTAPAMKEAPAVKKVDAPMVQSTEDTPMRGRFSPAVQRLAGEHGVDLNQVAGTGMGGRITRKDVLTFVENGSVPTAPLSPAPQATVNAPKSPVIQGTPAAKATANGSYDSQGDYHMDITPIRRTIANRMHQSVTEIPHAWTTVEVDVSNLVTLRKQLKEDFRKKEGINLTYLPFIVKAVVNALKEFPIINSSWTNESIVLKKDINISLAVGTEGSVSTPVIKKADQKSIAGLAMEIDELGRKAKDGKLSLNDMQGGTFTVNNTGAFGSILSYPIINYPQAAILSFESIVKRPVVVNDMIAIRSMANMCLSLDHRVLDGVICGKFLQKVKQNIENMQLDTQLY